MIDNVPNTLFRNKKFMLDEMFQCRNASKFGIHTFGIRKLHGFSYSKSIANMEIFC